MKRSTSSLALLLALQAIPVAGQEKLALVGGMLLDGYEVPPVHHAAVLVEGNRITRVGRAADIEIPGDFRVIDTSGRTMLPGLIDLHAHLMILGHGDYARYFSWLENEGFAIERIMKISARQLFNIMGLADVELVVKGGRVYDPASSPSY